MNNLRRGPGWYEQWIAGPAAEVRRREVAKELEQSIQSGHYDSETFEEFIQLVNHERLCVELQDTPEGPEKYRTALSENWTIQTIERVSDCLVRTDSRSSHYERELQSRLILSLLALLRAQGVSALHTNLYSTLHSHFEERYRDLQWNPQTASTFTRERFRRVQCSYLLCAGAEYSRHFRQAQPLLALTLSRVASLFFSILSIASIPMSGGAPDLSSTMEDIDTALRPLWRSPNERYQALFILQDLVQVTMAVNVYAQAKEDVVGNALINAKLQDRPNDALGWSRRLANIILIKVFTLLDDVEKFEAGISPPKSYKEFFLSYFSRGPPGIDDYFYCYGLLDIAAQLGRVVPNGSLPAALKRKLSAVFRNGNEPSYRWKATEVFLADPESRSAQSGFLKGEAPPGQRQEVDVIARVLSEEDGATRAQIRNSIAAGPSPWDSLTSNRLNDFRLRSEDWNEYSFPTFHLSHQAETSHVRIPLGSRLFPKRYLSAVLSPDCNSAAFLRSGSFHVCSIASFREIERTTIRSKTCPTGQDYRAVALSNQFLAVVTNTYLEVWRHSNGTEPIEPYPVESLYIVTDQDNGGWDPRCIAIYETADRVWIAVGGEASGHSGAIKVFLLNVAVQLTKLAHHDARFNSPYLLNGIPTTISFATDGSRLCCVTTSNKVLVWFLSNNMRPKHSPFKIEKVYQEETKAKGITSASVFNSPSNKTYCFFTTTPSSERSKHEGEWSAITPAASFDAAVPKKLEHQLSQISECRDIKTTERFITGAASPGGDAIALLDDKGRLILLRLEPNSRNRMSTARPPLQLEARLVSQEKASQASLRFCHKDGALYFFAVDTQGTVIRKRIEGASTAPLQPPQQAPAELAALLPAPVVQEASSVQASDGSRGSTSRHSHSGNSAVIELPPSPSQPQANPPQIQFQNPFPGRISFP